MFKYYETYKIKCEKIFNDKELQKITKDYKEYLENKYIDDIYSFINFIKYIFYIPDIPYDYELINSNVEEFYNKVKKYL